MATELTTKSLWYGIGGVCAFLLMIGVLIDGVAISGWVVADRYSTEMSVNWLERSGEHGRILGNPDGIAIVQYSSYICPFCSEMTPVLLEVLDRYDAHLVLKHAPAGGVDTRAAEAIECAGEHGKLWEMYDYLMRYGASTDLRVAASSIGVQNEAFMTCLENRTYQQLVSLQREEAKLFGYGLPLYVVGDQVLTGRQTVTSFSEALARIH